MQFDADSRQLDAMLRFVCQQASQLDPDTRAKLELACEEALTNVIWHAYEGQGGRIEITYRPREVVIKDWGRPFDPSHAPPVDPDETLEQRRVGGLGIFLLKKMLASVDYCRENGANILTLTV